MTNYFFYHERYRKIIFFIILLLCFLIPTQSSLYLSGIPITNIYSTIISIIYISFIIFNFYIFGNTFIKILIFIIFAFKISLLFLPVTGVELKQYLNNKDYLNDNFIKTYDTFWNKNSSYIQNHNFNKKINFPIDWTVHSKINFNDKNERYFNNFEEYLELKLIYNLDFVLYLPDRTEFKIQTEGNKEDNIIIKKINTNNSEILELNKNYIFQKGLYHIYGKISFSNSKWSLKYLYKDNNKYKNFFDERLIFLNKNNFSNFDIKYLFLKNISNLIDLLLITLILLSLLLFLKRFNYYFKSYYIFLIPLLPNLFYFLLRDYTDNFDLYGSFPVSVSYIISLILIFFFMKKIQLNSLNVNFLYFILIFPLLCLFYILKFYSELEAVSWWDYGDDWTAFQTFARAIVVDNEWLNAGEGIIYFRPGIRYVFAIIHILYGFSGFAQKIIEPILIFSGCYLFIFILLKFKIHPFISFLSSTLLISIFLGENYRWNISRGITEYYSFFLIILNCFLILKLDLKKNINFIIIAIFGILNVWLREDHIILIFFSYYLSMINKNYNDNLSFFSSIIKYTLNNFINIFLFGFILSLGLFILWIRNYYVGGNLGLDHLSLSSIRNYEIQGFEVDYFFNFYMLFTASIWPNLPRITTFLLFGTFLISILRLFNFKSLIYIHPSIIMLIAGCLIPGLLVPLIGYYPRYTIKYLPFCILVFSFIINKNYLIFSKLKINN